MSGTAICVSPTNDSLYLGVMPYIGRNTVGSQVQAGKDSPDLHDMFI